MEYLLETDNITKKYGPLVAVDHVSIRLKQGEIYGLIGRNGAGKTTLLKMLAGLAKPTEGSFTIFGESEEKTARMRDRVGVLIETPGLYPNLNAMANMKIMAMILGENDESYLQELLDAVGLSGVGKRKVKAFSMGMKQRLGIAMSLVGHPDILLLDEPINGLDPQGIVEVRELISRLNARRGSRSVLVTRRRRSPSSKRWAFLTLRSWITVSSRSSKDLKTAERSCWNLPRTILRHSIFP